MFKKIIFVARLIRIKQWVKNTFIFFPLLFAGKIFDTTLLINNSITFIGFSLVSSSLYILNDYIDINKDRHHPKKANRPLQQIKVNIPLLLLGILILQFVGLSLCKSVSISILFIVMIYIILNLIYNLFTKKIVLLDVIFIAFGFHLRIWAGSIATQVLPSVWLQLCVFLLALFLGFTKRRYEISSLKTKASEHRSVLSHYTSYLLDQIIIICSTLAIVFYGLYSISDDITFRLGNQNMVYSIVFVIYGIFRYLYLVHVKKLGNDPSDILFSDLPLIICIISWVSYVGILIYFPRI